MLIVRYFRYIRIWARLDGLFTIIPNRVGITVCSPEPIQRKGLAIRRHQCALTNNQGSTKSPQIEIAVSMKINDVLAVGQRSCQRLHFGYELLNPDWTITPESDYFFWQPACQRTQTECSSM